MTVQMVRTAALLPLVAPYVPTCPDFVAEQAIRMAAIEFAERSRAWRHVVSVDVFGGFSNLLSASFEGVEHPLIFVSGGMEFDATSGNDALTDMSDLPVVGAVIHEIEMAEFDGCPLTPIQFSTMKDVAEGQPRYITQSAPNALALIPFRAGRLDISLFLKPSSTVEFGTVPASPMFDKFNVIPDFFITLHGSKLASGALHKIMSIPDEPWSNPKEAARYGALFADNLNASFRGNMRGQQRAPIRTAFRDF